MECVLCGCAERRSRKSEEFQGRPGVVRQPLDHPQCEFHPASIHLDLKGAVRSNEIVGYGGLKKPPFQTLYVGPSMPGLTGQCWKPGPQGGIKPLDEGSRVWRLEQITEGKSALCPPSVRRPRRRTLALVRATGLQADASSVAIGQASSTIACARSWHC